MAADDTADLLRRVGLGVASVWPGTDVAGIEPLVGGTSSMTFRCRLGGSAAPGSLVVKLAPPGLPPVRNRDVLRQSRLLTALTGVGGVPVPEVYFEDSGDPPMFAMSHVAGECVEPMLADDDVRSRFDPVQIRSRAFDAVRALAALHAVPPGRVGLAREPVVDPRAEIARWSRALTTIPDDLRAGADRAEQMLLRTLPSSGGDPVVLHGDFRLGNTLCAGGAVAAVIDWEIWSVGHPLVDLTWLAFFCSDEDHPSAPRATRTTGMPESSELIDTYAELTGTPMPELAWFRALTRYKELAATALLVKRARKAGDLDDLGERMLRSLPLLVDGVFEWAAADRR